MGRPKALLPFAGVPLLTLLADRLADIGPVLVVAAPGQELPELPTQATVVTDAFPGEGPLGGLITGLRAGDPAVGRWFVSACDAPFLSVAVVRLLLERCPDGGLAIPEVAGQFYPLTAAYARGVLPAAEALFAQGERRARALGGAVPTVVVSEAEVRAVDSELRSLADVDTPEQWRVASDEWRVRKEGASS